MSRFWRNEREREMLLLRLSDVGLLIYLFLLFSLDLVCVSWIKRRRWKALSIFPYRSQRLQGCNASLAGVRLSIAPQSGATRPTLSSSRPTTWSIYLFVACWLFTVFNFLQTTKRSNCIDVVGGGLRMETGYKITKYLLSLFFIGQDPLSKWRHSFVVVVVVVLYSSQRHRLLEGMSPRTIECQSS